MRVCVLAGAVVCAAGAEGTLRVRVAGRTIEMPRERYVAGVLAGESSVFRSDEALKAMAVAARTYAAHHRGRHAAEGFDFCATTHCQRVDLEAVTERLSGAASATEGELLWKEGRPALTLYSLDCGRDPGSLTWTWRADAGRLVEALGRSQLRAPRDLRAIEVVQRNAAGRALTLALVGSETVRINAESFRLAAGREIGWNTVRSDLYEVRGLVFHGRGAGHGLGLCQRRADQMGVEGRGYREILAVSYPGTVLGVTARGISWQRLCGSAVCLMTTNPSLDRGVLATAERLASRLPWPVSGVEVRVYPDVDTFRDATGEPGWVAAHTSGKRVHVQPAAKLASALEKTLRHELLHVAIEAQAGAELPVWFHEGLALYLEGGVRGVAPIPNDVDLRRTGNPAAVRRAYDQAGQAVAGLVARYGETAVLGWVRRGLPPEVRNASSSQAATKSK